MTTPSIGFNFQYSNEANRWRDVNTGRFASGASVVSEMRVHQTATFSSLDNITTSLYSGAIDIAEWQSAIALELKDAHLAQAMFGAGGLDNMTPAKWGRVGGTLADEYRHLTNFANDIANGNVSEAQAMARIKQYGNATQQSYWREFAQSSTALLYWLLSAVRNCPDCIDLASGGPYTADTIPTFPGAGATRCHGNCKCTLERRVVPDAALVAQNQRIIDEMGVTDG